MLGGVYLSMKLPLPWEQSPSPHDHSSANLLSQIENHLSLGSAFPTPLQLSFFLPSLAFITIEAPVPLTFPTHQTPPFFPYYKILSTFSLSFLVLWMYFFP